MKANQLESKCGHKKERKKVSNIDDPLNWFSANDPITHTIMAAVPQSESFSLKTFPFKKCPKFFMSFSVGFYFSIIIILFPNTHTGCVFDRWVAIARDGPK
jgi:hypothetical protein